jgi:hypothetical protein
MKKIMKEKNQVVPDEVLSKEFLSQFKTEADVSKFLKQLQTLSQKVCLISSKKGPTLACQP